MSCYATKRLYGGRRARVGDAVLLALPSHDDPTKVCLQAGVVVAVSRHDDRPYLQHLKTSTVDWNRAVLVWTFVDARGQASALAAPLPRSSDDWELALEAAIESMPVGSWTWPP